jgi:hypothetical protein
MLIIIFLLAISRYLRSLCFPFLPAFFVDKIDIFTPDSFEKLQNVKDQLFKTSYAIDVHLKRFLNNSTIDLTSIKLKEFIDQRYSFAQL